MSAAYYTLVQRAVKSIIQSLPGFAGIPVKRRKRAYIDIQRGDVLPMVTISPTKEDVAKLYMPDGIWIDYPVLIVTYQTLGATLESEAELDWMFDRRQELRQALFETSLPGAPSIFDCNYVSHPVFDTGGLDQLFDISAQLFTFRSNETQ